jgi:nitrate/TMAO reductase-like tetraheme cytochrome c subunit
MQMIIEISKTFILRRILLNNLASILFGVFFKSVSSFGSFQNQSREVNLNHSCNSKSKMTPVHFELCIYIVPIEFGTVAAGRLHVLRAISGTRSGVFRLWWQPL